MKDQIYAVGVEYVTENGNTTASVNGCTETSVKIREECKLSCISESLFIKLRERVGLEVHPVEIEFFMYKNKTINILEET